jgi:hypothetical protein
VRRGDRHVVDAEHAFDDAGERLRQLNGRRAAA